MVHITQFFPPWHKKKCTTILCSPPKPESVHPSRPCPLARSLARGGRNFASTNPYPTWPLLWCLVPCILVRCTQVGCGPWLGLQVVPIPHLTSKTRTGTERAHCTTVPGNVNAHFAGCFTAARGNLRVGLAAFIRRAILLRPANERQPSKAHTVQTRRRSCLWCCHPFVPSMPPP